ncbi:hypothetical protein GCK32_000423 [Trichostrongylus colubriformis]|uniref:Uncharacterized protein n=1 Tax=Trichostrongylus colubriformis TaxID=6319 RepID=A0AAN8FG64_TRICO
MFGQSVFIDKRIKLLELSSTKHGEKSSVLPPAPSAKSANGSETGEVASKKPFERSLILLESKRHMEEENSPSKAVSGIKEDALSETSKGGRPSQLRAMKGQSHPPPASKLDLVISKTTTTQPPEAHYHPRGTSPWPPASELKTRASTALKAKIVKTLETVPGSQVEDTTETDRAETEDQVEYKERIDDTHGFAAEGENVKEGSVSQTKSDRKKGEQFASSERKVRKEQNENVTSEPQEADESEKAGSSLKLKGIMEGHFGHTQEQEEGEDAFDKSIAENEAAGDGRDSSEEEDKQSKAEEPAENGETEGNGTTEEKNGFIPEPNEAKGEHGKNTEVTKLAKKTGYIPQKTTKAAGRKEAEGKPETAISKVNEKMEPEEPLAVNGQAEQAVARGKVSEDKKVKEQQRKPKEKVQPSGGNSHTAGALSAGPVNKATERTTDKAEAAEVSTDAGGESDAEEEGYEVEEEASVSDEGREENETFQSSEQTQDSLEKAETVNEMTESQGAQNKAQATEDEDGTETKSFKKDPDTKKADPSVPVIEIDSKTKDSDIVIAYMPTHAKKFPSKAELDEDLSDISLAEAKSSVAKLQYNKEASYVNVPGMASFPTDISEQKENKTSSIIVLERDESSESSEESSELPEVAPPISTAIPREHKAGPFTNKHGSSISTPHTKETKSSKFGLHSIPRLNMHRKLTLTNFPRPEELPITITLPKGKHLPVKTSTLSFPVPRRLPTNEHTVDMRKPNLTTADPLDLDVSEEVPNDNSTVPPPTPEKPSQKSKLSELPEFDDKKATAGKHLSKAKYIPREKNPTNFPVQKKPYFKKTISKFPRSKNLPIKKFVSEFSRSPQAEEDATLDSISPIESPESSTKVLETSVGDSYSPTEVTPLEIREPGDRPLVQSSLDSEEGAPSSGESEAIWSEATSSEEGPNDHDPANREHIKVAVSEFPRPGYLTMNPSFLTLNRSGKVVPSFIAVPSKQSSVESGGVAIFLSSNYSISGGGLQSHAGSSLINELHPQPPPLNVTITRRTVRKYRKTHRNSAKTFKRDGQEKATTIKEMKPDWNSKMIPESFPAPSASTEPPATSTSIAVMISVTPAEPKAEALATPLPVERLAGMMNAKSIAEPNVEPGNQAQESIDELVSVKSFLSDGIHLPLETTTPWEYVTAPGERTAAPELRAAHAALDSLLVEADRLNAENGIKPIEIRRSPEFRSLLHNHLGEARKDPHELPHQFLQQHKGGKCDAFWQQRMARLGYCSEELDHIALMKLTPRACGARHGHEVG